MRKIIKYKVLGILVLLAAITSCETAKQDVEPIVSTDGYPVVTFTPKQTYTTVKEGDTLVYNISIDKLIDRSLTFSARIIGGNGDENDIIITPGVIAPYSKQTAVKVVIPQDWDIEGDETMKLEFGMFSIADRYILDPATVNPVLNLTVKNYIANILTISMKWDVDVEVQEEIEKTIDIGYDLNYLDTVDVVVNGADEIDYDVYVSSTDGFDITDPWSSDIWFAAETGDHPEVMEVSELEDGEYVVWGFLYTNGIASYVSLSDSTALIPITSVFEVQGAEYAEVVQDESQAIFGYTTGYSPAATRQMVYGIAAYITVADGLYTISDYQGNATDPWLVDSAEDVKGSIPRLLKAPKVK